MVEDRTLVFVYGTLKRGFPNHPLLADLIAAGDAIPTASATAAATCLSAVPLPLVLGPFSIPFLLPFDGSGERVSGELYALSPRALAVVDELEGVDRGHYERRPIAVAVCTISGEEEEVDAEAYFAHRRYAAELWRRCGERGLEEYSEERAREYVRPTDRPVGTTFVDAVRIFLASSSPSPDK